MKTRSIIFGMFIMLVIASGCTSTHQSQFSGPWGGTSVDPVHIKAEIEVGEKISGTASGTVLCFCIAPKGLLMPDKFADGVSYGATGAAGSDTGLFAALKEATTGHEGTVRDAAAYDAVSRSRADIIVAPRYITELNDFIIFKTLNVTVTGYKGTIKTLKQSSEKSAEAKIDVKVN
ncbi:MAG: hypothetical protein OEW15_10825 [Nitrospirota bacterium]|nr:hypothetical protein [Nitrospirota bacterium]